MNPISFGEVGRREVSWVLFILIQISSSLKLYHPVCSWLFEAPADMFATVVYVFMKVKVKHNLTVIALKS